MPRPLENIKLLVFDLDGTLRDRNGFPNSIISGLEHQAQQGRKTTLATGRAPGRLLPLLGNHRDTIIQPQGTPEILETGGRIVRDGKLVAYNPLKANEIDAVVDVVKKSDTVKGKTDNNGYNITFAIYCPKNEPEKTVAWVADMTQVAKVRGMMGAATEILTQNELPIDQLSAKIQQDQACSISISAPEQQLPLIKQKLPKWAEINEKFIALTSQGVDKGSGVRRLSSILHIPLENICVVGNSDNDLTMINLAGIGHAVIVGPEIAHNQITQDSRRFTRVANMQALGDWLKQS